MSYLRKIQILAKIVPDFMDTVLTTLRSKGYKLAARDNVWSSPNVDSHIETTVRDQGNNKLFVRLYFLPVENLVSTETKYGNQGEDDWWFESTIHKQDEVTNCIKEACKKHKLKANKIKFFDNRVSFEIPYTDADELDIPRMIRYNKRKR